MASGLLGQLMANARKAEIGYGIHENCVITSVSNEERKSKEGEKRNLNSYTRFEMLDEDGKSTAMKEVAWYNFGYKEDYAFDSFINQLEQFTGIVDILYPVTEKKDKWGDEFMKILENNEIEISADNGEGIKSELKSIFADDLDLFAAVHQDVINSYVEFVSAKAGLDGPRMRLKIVFDPKGKNLGQPKFDKFTESMEVDLADSGLKLTSKDEEYRANSLESVKKPKPSTSKL